MPDNIHLLALDTCGPTGSVALGHFSNGQLTILGSTQLAGRSFSATLVKAIGDLLAAASLELSQLKAMVVVHGPGSFTGVRVGLSAAMGLAEGASLPVLTLTRLEVLASLGKAEAAALDAHRQEIFLRLAESAGGRELLAGSEDLAALAAPASLLYCEDAASVLVAANWPATELIKVAEPTASDALALALPRVLAAEFTLPELLDGHYLRRSDAEIYAEPGAVRP